MDDCPEMVVAVAVAAIRASEAGGGVVRFDDESSAGGTDATVVKDRSVDEIEITLPLEMIISADENVAVIVDVADDTALTEDDVTAASKDEIGSEYGVCFQED